MKYLLLLLAIASTPSLAFDTNACHALCVKMSQSHNFKAYYFESTGTSYPSMSNAEAYGGCGYQCTAPDKREEFYANLKTATQNCIKAKGAL